MKRLPVRVAGVFLVAFVALTFAHFAFSTTLFETDAYYHLRMSLRYRDQGPLGVGAEMPEAAHSLYATQFADKEWGYHVLCVPFLMGWTDQAAPGDEAESRYADRELEARVTARLAAGEPVSWPWEGTDTVERRGKFIAAFFAALMVASMYALFRLHGAAWAGPLTLLLLLGGELFWARMVMMRPHVLAIVLLLWIWHATLRKRPWLLFALSIAFVLCYTAAHAPLALVVVIVIAQRARGEQLRRTMRWPAIAFAGIVLGFALHPHPLNYLQIFFAQNVTILTQSALRPVFDAAKEAGWLDLLPESLQYLVGRDVLLGVAGELSPGIEPKTINSIWMMWVPWLALLVLMLKWRPRISRTTATLLALTAAWTIMFASSQRYIEFLCPFATLALGLLLRDMREARAIAGDQTVVASKTRTTVSRGDRPPLTLLQRRRRAIVLAVCTIPFAIAGVIDSAAIAAPKTFRKYDLGSRDALLAIDQDAREQARRDARDPLTDRPLVFHVGTSTGQMGVLYAPHARFQLVQDNVFLYMYDPELYELAINIILIAGETYEVSVPGRPGETRERHFIEILRDLDVRYVLVDHKMFPMINKIESYPRDFVRIFGDKEPWPYDADEMTLTDLRYYAPLWYLDETHIVFKLLTQEQRTALPPAGSEAD